jgi:hypothetical protein
MSYFNNSKSTPFSDLTDVKEMIIDQRSYIGESAGKTFGSKWADIPNVYDLIVPEGKHRGLRYQATEHSSWWGRCLCTPNHEVSLGLKAVADGDTNGSGMDIITIEKPFRGCCPALTPLCQKELSVTKNGHGHLRGSAGGNSVVGRLRQPLCGGCFTPTLHVYGEDDEGGQAAAPVGYITGPCCCIGGCYSSNFNVTSSSGAPIASIRRLGAASGNGLSRSLFTDADRYRVQFASGGPADELEPLQKLVVLSGALMLDYMFFEGETAATFSAEQWPPKCSFKCCDLYCCGCLLPLRCNCDLQSKAAKAQARAAANNKGREKI